MNAHTSKALMIGVAAAVLALAHVEEGRPQRTSLQSQSLANLSLVTAEIYTGRQPLKALAPMGQIKNMRSLVKAPNVPADALTGATEFNDSGVGMVVLPEKYVSLVVKLVISVRSKTSVKASELMIIDAQRNKHLGILWDDGLHAWVCSDAEYERGQYEDYVIFILPLSTEKADIELWLKDQKIASITEARRRSDSPQVSAKAIIGRILKESPLGDSVMIKDGKLVDVGSFMTMTGNRMTIVEPKKD